jgi:hypothetical protein
MLNRLDGALSRDAGRIESAVNFVQSRRPKVNVFRSFRIFERPTETAMAGDDACRRRLRIWPEINSRASVVRRNLRRYADCPDDQPLNLELPVGSAGLQLRPDGSHSSRAGRRDSGRDELRPSGRAEPRAPEHDRAGASKDLRINAGQAQSTL